MTGTVAITDHGWYEFLREQKDLDEVNFWTPSAYWGFRAEIGSPFFFKLKARYNNAICGFAFFARFTRLPDWLAWESFDIKNGCPDLESMRQRIAGIRESINFKDQKHGDQIGCILLSQPTFFKPDEFVAGPRDWPPANLRNKKYSLTQGEGKRIWDECIERATAKHAIVLGEQPAKVAQDIPRYGTPLLVKPRLGQGLFRVAVLDAYGRACAVTGEHSLPALEASHIKPFAKLGPHDVSNGILLRADLHRLFEQGYVTVSPEYKLEVSMKLKADFQNGHSYYPLHGRSIILPSSENEQPDRIMLTWHNEHVFRAA